MRAIVKTPSGIELRDISPPDLRGLSDVIIQVQAAGLCRTDVYVADGIIPSKAPLVLGHEFSGVVHQIGSHVEHVRIGDRVTAMPIIPCGHCQECSTKRTDICQDSSMLGLDRDGAFAEYVSVPASVVYPVPSSVSFLHAAYSEPIAASMAVLKSGIRARDTGLVYGENRISTLTSLILQAHGFRNIEMTGPLSADHVVARRGKYDFIVETLATTQTMQAMQDMIRPGGKIILKSRKHELVGIDVNKAVRKEIQFISVNYGNFAQGIELMASGKLKVDHLFEQRIYQMEEYQEFLDAGRSGEARKLFMQMSAAAKRRRRLAL